MQVMYGKMARATFILSSIPSLKRLKLRKLLVPDDDKTCSTLYAVPGALPVGDERMSWFKVAVTAFEDTDDSPERIKDDSVFVSPPAGFESS